MYRARLALRAEQQRDEAYERAAKFEAILNTPMLHPFMEAAVHEAQHQVYRWGEEHDAKKTAWDWFWTLGYLGGKAAQSAVAEDWDKARHHTITAAAMLANWHRQIDDAVSRSRND